MTPTGLLHLLIFIYAMSARFLLVTTWMMGLLQGSDSHALTFIRTSSQINKSIPTHRTELRRQCTNPMLGLPYPSTITVSARNTSREDNDMNATLDFLEPDPEEEKRLQALIPLAYRDITLIPEEAWQLAIRRRDLIKPLLEHSSSADFKKVAEQHEVSERSLRRWIQSYSKSGYRVEALFDRSLISVRAGSPLDPRTNTIIEEELEKWINDKNRPPRSDVIQTVRGRCRQVEAPQPSRATVYRRLAAIPPGEIIKGQKGQQPWASKYRQFQGDAPRGICPLDLVEGDHVLLDIEVLSEDRTQILGRPWLTALMDVYSSCSLALIAQMDRPGLGEVGYAIGMAVLPKTPVLLRFDLDLPWPCQGLFGRLHVDNALELSGSMSLIRSLGFYGIDHQSRLIRKPESGPHIERFFREVQREMHRLPGTTFSDPDSRGDYPSEKKACFTFTELERYLFRWVLGTYHRRPSEALDGLTPLQKWQTGIEGTLDSPGMGEPVMPQDPQRFFIDFLPMNERQVDQDGIRIRNMWYQSDGLRNLIGLQDPKQSKLALKVFVRTDIVDLSRIFVLDPRTNSYLVVPLRTLGRPAISLRELKVIRRSILDRLHCPVTEELIFREREHLRALAESSIKLSKRAKFLHQRTRKLLHQTAPLHTDRLPAAPSPDQPQPANAEASNPSIPRTQESIQFVLQDIPESIPQEWPEDFFPNEEDL